jgi:uridine phosphorylase
MKSVYHLHLTDEQIEGAKIALLPGDPARVEKIARSAPSHTVRAWLKQSRALHDGLR